ncbi:hypothetical protein CBR_g3973 [Chara braunii]|uniref:Uncharacterized protein n=1 Tax=Chara braunii TaxID=69332 RepID=A0A388KGT1_CHABU|nr:hypothetical protein CBR_g3973 [Chara braunii]|eukprot:GBG69274.1 hypothetical protein CBR_g3973 [Chara braunii]
MRDMARNEQNAQNFNNQASSSNSPPIFQAPGALVPYQPPPNDGRSNNNSNVSNNDSGYYSRGAGGYSGGYRRSWNHDSREKGDRFERMWSWMSSKMQERERVKKEQERKARDEEEGRRVRELEEKKLAEQKERDDFKASIGAMVQNEMQQACEQVLGRKVTVGENPLVAAMQEVCRRTVEESRTAKSVGNSWEKLDVIEKLKQDIDELRRQTQRNVQPDQGITTLKTDNQLLIQDLIHLKEEVEHLKRGEKRASDAVTEKSPPEEPARAKSKNLSEPTPAEYVKLAEAYRRIRDDKDVAEREIQALKERTGRIVIPTSNLRTKKSMFRSGRPTNLKHRLNKEAQKGGGEGASGGKPTPIRFVKNNNED